CLVGKSGNQFGLPVGKRARGRSLQREYADGCSIAFERDAEHGARSRDMLQHRWWERIGEFRISLNVRDVNNLPFNHSPPRDRVSTRGERMLFHVIYMFGRVAIPSELLKELSLGTSHSG